MFTCSFREYSMSVLVSARPSTRMKSLAQLLEAHRSKKMRLLDLAILTRGRKRADLGDAHASQKQGPAGSNGDRGAQP